MMKKTCDINAIREAQETIRQTLNDNPDARERTAAFFAADPDDAELEELQGDRMTKTPAPITVRLPQNLVDRLDQITPLLTNTPEFATMTTVSRSDALRLCVLRGLEELEKSYLPQDK